MELTKKNFGTADEVTHQHRDDRVVFALYVGIFFAVYSWFALVYIVFGQLITLLLSANARSFDYSSAAGWAVPQTMVTSVFAVPVLLASIVFRILTKEKVRLILIGQFLFVTVTAILTAYANHYAIFDTSISGDPIGLLIGPFGFACVVFLFGRRKIKEKLRAENESSDMLFVTRLSLLAVMTTAFLLPALNLVIGLWHHGPDALLSEISALLDTAIHRASTPFPT